MSGSDRPTSAMRRVHFGGGRDPSGSRPMPPSRTSSTNGGGAGRPAPLLVPEAHLVDAGGRIAVGGDNDDSRTFTPSHHRRPQSRNERGSRRPASALGPSNGGSTSAAAAPTRDLSWGGDHQPTPRLHQQQGSNRVQNRPSSSPGGSHGDIGTTYIDRELRDIERSQAHRRGVAEAERAAQGRSAKSHASSHASTPTAASAGGGGTFRPYRGEGIVDLELAAKESVLARGTRMASRARQEPNHDISGNPLDVLSSVRRRSHQSQRAGGDGSEAEGGASSVLDAVRSLTRAERDTLHGWAVRDAERAARLGDHGRRTAVIPAPRPRSGAPRSSTSRRLGKLDTWLGHVLTGVTRRGDHRVRPPSSRQNRFDPDGADHPELLARIAALERENDRLMTQVADLTEAQSKAHERAEKEKESLRGQVKGLEAALASAQDQLREMQHQQDAQTGVQVSDGTAITNQDDQLAAVTAVLNDEIDKIEFFDLLDHIPTSVKNEWLLTMSLQLRTLGKLISLNDAINDNLSKMETAMGKITEEACEVLQAERSTVFAIDYANRELYSIITGGDGNIEIRLPDNTGIVGHVYQTNELVNIQDAYDDPRFNREVDKRSGLRTKAILCAPIWAHAGLKIGLLQTINKRGGGVFDKEDEAKIQALALKVGIHLYHAAVYEDATRFMRSRPVLHTIMTSFLNELDLGVEMDSIVEEICDKLGAERASVFLADFSSQELFSTSAKNTDFQIRIPWNAGIAGLCFTSGETINIPDAYQDERFNQAVDKRTGFKTTQILCMPMRNADDVVVGIVQAINRVDDTDPFDQEDEYYLNRISIQASFTLSYASSFARALSK